MSQRFLASKPITIIAAFELIATLGLLSPPVPGGWDVAWADRFDACNSANQKCQSACNNVANAVIEATGSLSGFNVDACLNVCAHNQNVCTEKVEANGSRGARDAPPKKPRVKALIPPAGLLEGGGGLGRSGPSQIGKPGTGGPAGAPAGRLN